MKHVRQILFNRLRMKGLDPSLIPCFMKFMDQVIPELSHVTQNEVNERLHFLGWDDFHVDYHTLELILASLESGDLTTAKCDEDVSGRKNFRPDNAHINR